MLTLEDGRIRFALDKCMQCGICLPSCPTGSLSAKLLPNGTSEIACEHGTCTRCRICVRTCPVEPAMKSPFDYEQYLESNEPILAWARDADVRRDSSSGGVARTLIVEGLKSGFFDGAYALVKIPEYPFAAGRVIERADYDMISNSVYHPVLAMENFHLERNYRNFLVVGTTCQLASVERMARKKVENLYRVAIFCKQQKTLDSTRSIAKRLGDPPLEIASFRSARYRGPQWPGAVRINDRSMPYEEAAALSFGKRLWKVPGCNLCSDPFGAGADLALMDPWGIEPSGTSGKNLVYSTTAKGRELLERMDEWLETQPVDPKRARECTDPLDLEYKRIFRERRKKGLREGLPERLESLQARAFEVLASRLRLPRIAYKVLARLPDVKRLILALYRSRT